MSLPTEPSIYIAAFAAIISTIALLWNIANAILGRKAKLRVELTVIQQMAVDPVQGLGNPIPKFDITITNVGALTRNIRAPMFQFRRKKEGLADRAKRFQVIDMTAPTTYPLELRPGQQYNYKVGVQGFVQHFKGQLSTKERIRIEVQDTHNKRYHSRRMSLRAVATAMHVAVKMRE